MTLTLTPLPSDVSARSLLPNTDPASGVVTATGRPTRHAWAVGQTVLAAMGVRLDLTGSGRRHGEDLQLLNAWFTAHQVKVLVIRHATNITDTGVLDDLLHVTTATGTDLALTCDDTTGGHLVDWVNERSGTVHTTHQPLMNSLNLVRRPTAERGLTTVEDCFPPLLPRVDFYLFRARCRDLLTPEDFAAVDAHYIEVFRNVRDHPYASNVDASTRLTATISGTDNPGAATTTLRAAQAAMFTHGLLLKVNVDYFLGGIRESEHRRLTAPETTALRAYRTPWRSASVVLRDSNLALNQITALTLNNVTPDGDLVGVDHAPLLDEARLFMRAQRVHRLTLGAGGTDPFITEAGRYVAQAQRRASVDLNLPITPAREPSNTPRSERWTKALGVTLLPLVTQHLTTTETTRERTHP